MRRLLISLVALALVATACGDDETGPTGVQLVASDLQRAESEATQEDIAAVAQAERDLAAALYTILAEEHDNLVFSPISIHIAMAMALAGAEGDTEAQIAAALGVDDIPEDRMHSALNALDALLEARNRVDPPQDGEERKVQLSIVNSLWGQSGFGFEQAFLDVLAANYGAGMRVVDFKTAAEEARVAINDWVAEQTNDRITDLLPEGAVDDMSRLVLTNAVYLDATWAEPFDPQATSDAVFRLPDGTEVIVPTMHGMLAAGYASGDGWQALDLGYTGGELSMLLILPDEGRFEEVEGKLPAGLIDEVIAALTDTEAQVSLPKFEIRTQADLNQALGALGIADAFDPARADFTGISTEEPLYVSGVLHEAFIAVDEAGTEAAAATAVIIGTTSLPIDVVEIDFDRPFLFALQDRETGTALFLGRVLDPSR
jgi:serpin B